MSADRHQRLDPACLQIGHGRPLAKPVSARTVRGSPTVVYMVGIVGAKLGASAMVATKLVARAFSDQVERYPAAVRKFLHSRLLNCSMAWEVAVQRSSMVRNAAACRIDFSLENAISIGLRSGEHGGR